MGEVEISFSILPEHLHYQDKLKKTTLRRVTFLFLRHPIGSLVSSVNDITKYSTVLHVSVKPDDFFQPRSILVGSIRFGENRPNGITVDLLNKLDVRQVVESSLLRGLGLSNDASITIIGVYICPNDPMCNGGGIRRIRRMRRLSRLSSTGIATTTNSTNLSMNACSFIHA